MEFKRAARSYCWGEGRGGGRGRTDRAAYVGHSTPVRYTEGDSAPEVKGLPYWKTGFRNGSFHKILYTSSTMRIVVGKDWSALE